MSMIKSVNLSSLVPHNSLSKAQSLIGKSIERLSTGLKINGVKDDPTGFTISEKMRSNIMGFKRASQNTQEATSYLQAAEGAASEVTSILQRMRELAVQGSSDTYTNSDRNQIQEEMGQLQAEIDRISETTEFNSIKLLSGDTTGAWLSNTGLIDASITGGVLDSNYNVFLDAIPGQNQIQKSQIFTIKEGEIGAEIKTTPTNTTNITSVSNPDNLDPTKSADYTVTVGNPNGTADPVTGDVPDSATLTAEYFQDGSNFDTATGLTAISTSESGYFMVEFTESSTTAAGIGTEYRVKFISAVTGDSGEWVNFTSGAIGSLSGSYTSNGFNVDFNIPITTATAAATVKEGDKLLFAVSDLKNLDNTVNLTTNGGGTVQLEQDGVTSPKIIFTAINSITPPDNQDNDIDINNINITMVSLDPSNGDFSIGSIDLGFKENNIIGVATGHTISGTATVEIRGAGDPATSTTQLSQIKNFIDSDGNEMFEFTQELSISSNGKSYTIFLNGVDTMASLNKKIEVAIIDKLNMDSGNSIANSSVAQYVPIAKGSALFTVQGTIVIQSPITGDAGDISFGGSERLLKAFGFSDIQTSTNNITTLEVKNSHTGESAGSVTVTDARTSQVIGGLEVMIDSRAGVTAEYNNITDRIEFVQQRNIESRFMSLHVVDNRQKVQLGIREGETLDIIIPELTTKSLNIDTISVATNDDAQESITKIDNALKTTLSVRTTIGTQINRLESAYNTLQSSHDNMVTAESKIRDLDIAEESTLYAQAQLLLETSTSILAQANQISQLALKLLQG